MCSLHPLGMCTTTYGRAAPLQLAALPWLRGKDSDSGGPQVQEPHHEYTAEQGRLPTQRQHFYVNIWLKWVRVALLLCCGASVVG